MIIAVASGKGGTGKTTVAVNLAKVLGAAVHLLDCDVEEPNSLLFLKGVKTAEEEVCIPVPQVDEEMCNGCGECSRFCRYNAVVILRDKPVFFPEMCHGCGGCMKVCPKEAIREVDRRIGVVETYRSGDVTLVQGRLDVGVSVVPPLIRGVKAHLPAGVTAILDAPPGTSCPVIATLQGVDFVILVTEPTPFGLHDLKLAVDMVRSLRIPLGVVLNRAGIGDDRVHRFCREENIPILVEIPFERKIAEVASRGSLIVDALPEYRPVFRSLIERTIGNTAGQAEAGG